MRMTESTAKPNSNTLTNILIHTMRNKTRTHIHDTHTLTGSHAELLACPPTKQQHGSRAFCSSAKFWNCLPLKLSRGSPMSMPSNRQKTKNPTFFKQHFSDGYRFLFGRVGPFLALCVRVRTNWSRCVLCVRWTLCTVFLTQAFVMSLILFCLFCCDSVYAFTLSFI